MLNLHYFKSFFTVFFNSTHNFQEKYFSKTFFYSVDQRTLHTQKELADVNLVNAQNNTNSDADVTENVGYNGDDNDPELDNDSEYSDREDEKVNDPLPVSCFDAPPLMESIVAEPERKTVNKTAQKKPKAKKKIFSMIKVKIAYQCVWTTIFSKRRQ